ncbi:hypothetical protein SAMN03159424_00773 [Pseudomonas sp. NFACC05-1]|nr:hypothetical protein SAMN03159424_00773 [Pseudomonas sp. NFACC05-1]
MAPPRVQFSCCSAVAVIEMRCRGDCVGRREFAKRGFLSLLGRKKMGYCPGVIPKGTRRVLFAAETCGTCGEGACSRWAAQRPQTYHQGLSGGLRPAFRLLRSQREQAPSPQERFSGVARRSMHAVAPPLTSTSWRGNAFVARELAPAGVRSGPKPVAKVCQADCVQLVGCCAASGSKLPRHKSGLAVWQEGRCTR